MTLSRLSVTVAVFAVYTLIAVHVTPLHAQTMAVSALDLPDACSVPVEPYQGELEAGYHSLTARRDLLLPAQSVG